MDAAAEPVDAGDEERQARASRRCSAAPRGRRPRAGRRRTRPGRGSRRSSRRPRRPAAATPAARPRSRSAAPGPASTSTARIASVAGLSRTVVFTPRCYAWGLRRSARLRALRYPAAPMRVLILGGDGYLGWPTALRFSAARPRGLGRRQLRPPPLGGGRRQRLADPDPRPRPAYRGLGGGLGQRDPQLRRLGRGRRASSTASSPRPAPRRSSTTASRPRRPTRWPRASRRSRPSTGT